MAYEIRTFKASDKPQILEIARRTWGGHDHLPHVIDKWAADPSSHLYVMDYRGRVVSVANLKLIEGGRTGWMEGLRVHPRYRKRGLAGLMTQHLVKAASDLRVQRLRLIATMDNAPSLKLARVIGMSELLRMSVFWRGVREAGDWKHKSPPLSKIDADHAFDALQQSAALLPGNAVIYHWYALDATRDSLREIDNTADFWAGEHEGRTVSLSIGLATAEGNERVWCCTIYAIDTDAFLSCLSHHLAQARRRRIPVLMGIHQLTFEGVYKRVPWLRRGGHRIRLGLFQKQVVSD